MNVNRDNLNKRIGKSLVDYCSTFNGKELVNMAHPIYLRFWSVAVGSE